MRGAPLILAVLVGAAACTQAGQITVSDELTPTIAWEECADRLERTYPGVSLTGFEAECGRMVVPLAWDRSQPGTLRLALVRLRSEDQHDRIGSLVINPGGPGGSGVDAAVLFAGELPSQIAQRFDVVGFDPRGVGKSTPLVCDLFGFGTSWTFDVDPEDLFDLHSETRQANGDCAERRAEVVPWINTVQTARDLDAIRSALGDQALTYLGWSYGTELGAIYAELYPDRIRALVLDGALDLALADAEIVVQQVDGFERAFQVMAQRCDTDRDCPFGPDAAERFDELRDDLSDDPVDTDDGWYVDGDTIGWDTLFVLYDDREWSRWMGVLADLADGDGASYDDFFDSYVGVTQYRNLGDAFTAVMCADRADRLTPTQAADEAARVGATARRFGPALSASLVRCAGWPVGATPLVPVEAASAPPILVIGTRDDPATPYPWAVALRHDLATASLLTWEGAGHTAFPKTACINAAVSRYLIDLEVPPDGTRCPA